MEKVKIFQYSGNCMAINDLDEMAVINNVKKAQNKWKRLPSSNKRRSNTKNDDTFLQSSSAIKPSIRKRNIDYYKKNLPYH